MTMPDVETRKAAVVDAPANAFFSELIEAAGLDPLRDLRFGNWSGIDLSGDDLRGFDFTGADLRGVRFNGARIDGARFDQAHLDRDALGEASDWAAHLKSWSRADHVPRGGHLHAFAPFSDAPFAPEMILLPPGRFVMGASREEHERFEIADNEWASWERPQRDVVIEAGFALARDPVTFDAYDFFCRGDGRKLPEDNGWGRGNRPVINVSWEDACAYCAWLSVRSGAAYRLPSEAEWEYACRAGTTTAFAWGDDWDPARANCAEGGPSKTSQVGDYPANAWGLRDLHGNVWEWCADEFEEDPRRLPADGSPYLPQQGNTSRRVVRGGSWDYGPQFLRSAVRSWSEPDSRVNNLGFRPARTPLTP